MKNNKTRQEFLLSFFKEKYYAEKEVNGFWLIRQWNANTKEWQVAIFSKEAFMKYKEKTPQKTYFEKREQL